MLFSAGNSYLFGVWFKTPRIGYLFLMLPFFPFFIFANNSEFVEVQLLAPFALLAYLVTYFTLIHYANKRSLAWTEEMEELNSDQVLFPYAFMVVGLASLFYALSYLVYTFFLK